MKLFSSFYIAAKRFDIIDSLVYYCNTEEFKMILIVTEKEDMGAKIAAGLDCIKLPSGKKVTLSDLPANEKEVKKLQLAKGYFDILFAGKPCKVTWAFGHLYGLKDVFEYNADYEAWKARPVVFIPEKFELHPITSKVEWFAKKNDKQRETLKKLFSEATQIINATDDDREGEVIFSYIYEALKCKKPCERVKLVKTTESGIRDAFKNRFPASERYTLGLAGRARNIYDWLIGTNLTTRFTLKNPGNGVLSVGRVQTTVLKLIVDRELAISGFKSSVFWSLKALFTTEDKETYDAVYEKERFDKKADADALLAKVSGKKGEVTDIASKRVKRETPLLYSQTLLAIEANKRFGYTAEKTLEITQWLYEQGYSTYPRTKSQVLNDDMMPEVIKVLGELKKNKKFASYLDIPLKPHPKYFNSAKVDSHFAIIPTEKVPATFTAEQDNIYTLIAHSLIRTIYPDAIIESTTIITSVSGEKFISKGSTIVDVGWLAVGEKMKEEFLPSLTEGEIVDGSYEVKEGKTNPPKHYTDASILSAMVSAGKDLEDEELKKILATESVNGIGTDATRANIIEKLVERKYINRKGKVIFATEKGIEFINHFPVEEIKSASFTAEMEKRLSDIEHGTETYDSFIADVIEQTKKWCYIIHDSGTTMSRKEEFSGGGAASTPPASTSTKKKGVESTCPNCGKSMALKKGTYGEFYACTGYPTCKTTQPVVKKTAVKCPKCGMPIVEKKSKAGKIFYGCSGYPKCAHAFWDKPVNKKCPQCGAIAVVNTLKRTKYKCSEGGCRVEFD